MSDTTFDLVLTNGRVVLEDGVQEGGLAIRAGQIAQVLGAGEAPRAQQTYDVGGGYILPGLIDSHVHFRTPGLTHKETWQHASRAAAAGGVTTVLDMPNTAPALTDPAQVAEKAALISGQSLVDFGFHMGVMPGQVERLEGLVPGSVASIKVFMAGHHTAPNVITEQADLERIFRIAARHNIPVTLHAEDQQTFRRLEPLHAAATNLIDYAASRPRAAALLAVARVVELVRAHGTRAHILHASSAEEVELIEAAAQAGLPITFETTPHHLLLTSADGWRIGTRGKISPALRDERDRQRLWASVRAGTITSVGSDHAPHTLAEKSRPFVDAPPGLPGVQELLPVLLTGMAAALPDRTLDERMRLVAQLCGSGPARLFGLAHRKGALAPGLDADVAVVDVQARWKLTSDHIQALCGWSAYEGWELTGRNWLTIRRGEVIYREGQFGAASGGWVRG